MKLKILGALGDKLSSKQLITVILIWLALDTLTAYLPPPISERLPDILMEVVNVLTLHTANSKLTDVDGNPIPMKEVTDEYSNP